MQQLTARQKQVIELYYFSTPDMTEKKAAQILTRLDGKQITQQGVHKTLSLSIKKLQKLMGC
jgi:DNA-directed RNA polymerase specialized sigma subunit